jgi:hypothetical protein
MTMNESDADNARTPQAGARDRRRGGLRALSNTVRAVTKTALGRRSLAEAALLGEWPSIVGDEVARACQPRRIVFPNRNTRREGTLVLRVRPGEAPRLAHQEPILVERVNGFFGYRAVARLRLEPGPLPASDAADRRPARPLSEAESRDVETRVASVADDELRDALARLGRTLHAHDRK